MPPSSSSQRAQRCVDAAFKRSSKARSSRIENLPAELKFLIIERLPDVSSIRELALTGPVLYTVITENEAMIAERVVVANIGRCLMPVATALMELRALEGRLPRSYREGRQVTYQPELMQPVVKILDRHIGPGKHVTWHKEGRLTTFDVAHKYLTFNRVVDRWVRILAPQLIETVYMDSSKTSRGGRGRPTKPTRTELLRFHKALYLLELVRTAFPWPAPAVSADAEVYKRLCDQVSPWEMEQTRSLQLRLLLLLPSTREWTELAMDQPQRHIRLQLLNQFILTRDLATLLAMYDKGDNGLEGTKEHAALERYCMGLTFPYHNAQINPRVFAFPATADVRKFKFDKAGCTDLDAGAIFAKYPEEECGPQAWWYFRFLSSHRDLKNSYEDRHPFRKCDVYVLDRGYAFCDFATLSRLAHKVYRFPEPNDLLDWARSRSGGRSRQALEAAIVNSVEKSPAYCKCPRRRASPRR